MPFQFTKPQKMLSLHLKRPSVFHRLDILFRMTSSIMRLEAIRNATAHGFLSPTKAKELGMEQILQDLPKAREIHEALIIKLYSNFTKQGK
jgi:hypothetical protein